ncbi:PAS domain S-box protein [Anabaena cylindrica UHCC 0172]|uniref:hybrid sensor histidine kinase/response regulator n=1 Tax=Anabaena cylindrica TaxID=1165 RepID=UPI002B1FA135|nr:PAS domain S-box protein [Anabaena cylindrica]MEA5552006.1 PAS domain S-box protein [Anabaena cylindrica UHCC 0172]
MRLPVFNNEAARLEILHQYKILDTSPEEPFDDLALLAAQICNTPIAVINLIDAHRQWFKAKVGLDVQEMPRDAGFCPICVLQGTVLIIPDTLADENFATADIVTSEPYVRFYAGIPLIVPGGEVIGTLCVVDKIPRQITPQQLTALESISRLVVRQLEIRRNLAELSYINEEYKNAQLALRQSESTLHSFFESAPMMMGIVELVDNDILHISDNPNTAKFLGLTPEAMQNRLAREMCADNSNLNQWINYYRQAELTQSPVRFEYSYETSQGQTWLSATVSAIAKNHGSSQQFAYIVEDITERKQAEDELRWQEALLRSMNSVSPLAFYVVDNRTDNILYFNDRFCEIWKIEHLKKCMEAQELKNQDIVPDCFKLIADIPSFTASYQPLQDETNHSVIEDEISFNDGRIIRRFSTQIRNTSAQYFGRLYIFEDITARKQVEQKLREQAALLDITTDAIVVRDLENKILLWNKSAEKLYGWQAEEVIDKNASKIWVDEPVEEQQKIHQTVLTHGLWQGELNKKTKFGTEIIVESCWTLVHDEYNKANSILIIDTDITQKKQLEHQFLRAQRMESIGTLASGIAHDLNNVLSPILMSAHLLKNKHYNQENQQILSIIENNAKRGANLVKQVLSFARGIQGNTYGGINQRAVIQVKYLISEMQQIVEQTFPKSIIIHAEIQPNLSPVCGDITQLDQVLMNLCLNARDAMPNGGVLTITAENIWIDETYVKMHIDARVGSYLVIKISDTGTGIPSSILDRIFEPFFTTKEFGKGTGLGLSTVIGIIKGHGGFITVSSSVGKGTAFQLYLPAIYTEVVESFMEMEMPIGNGEWILLVDDEVSIQEITKTSLENYNYKVITASDGEKAVTLYKQNQDKINTAIIDMMMPNMDGATTIDKLQSINPQLRIIIISGLGINENILLENAYQNIDFLSKPFTVQELLKTLAQFKIK